MVTISEKQIKSAFFPKLSGAGKYRNKERRLLIVDILSEYNKNSRDECFG
jgi:hypothetical protein